MSLGDPRKSILGHPDAILFLRISELGVFQQGRKCDSSRRGCRRFDSVAEVSQCTDHTQSARSLGLLTHCWAAFLIANAFMQNDPDQLTQAMRNRADGFVVS